MADGAILVEQSSALYPQRLRELALADRYPRLWMVGDPGPLGRPLLGLLCSARCPGRAILGAYDLARALRDAGVAVVGGFQSPMEKECLDLLLRGTQPVVICPARSIEDMRFPAAWRAGLDARRVVVVSPFARSHRRVTAELAAERNHLVAGLAQAVVAPHAHPGGLVDRQCAELLAHGRAVWTLDLPENAALIAAGAKPAPLADVERLLR